MLLQETAFRASETATTCADVDRAVRAYYEQRRSDRQLAASHWARADLRYHEGPFLDRGDSTPLQPGMVFTVEPGCTRPNSAASVTPTWWWSKRMASR
ncbi:MAG: M24 family metallopeptidase [Anaerolineae bacterium]